MPDMQSWAVALENWIAHKEVFRPTVPVPVTAVFVTKDACRRRRDGSKFDFSKNVRAITREPAATTPVYGTGSPPRQCGHFQDVGH